MVLSEFRVFLSYRGEDALMGFIDHLYAALATRGIKAFKNYEVKQGEIIPQVAHEAIRNSQIAIVVISENYDSCARCLDELQTIVECRKELGKQVVPIFYGVRPSDVRHQTGSFAEAFVNHEGIFNKEKVQRWRDASTEIANIFGWNSRYWSIEAELIENIIPSIWTKLLPSYHNNDLIGIQSKISQMQVFLEMQLDDVRFIGIWVTPGIGKTTLARAVYGRISSQFEICCFLENIRETFTRYDEVYLQLELLSHFEVSNTVISNTDEGKNKLKDILSSKKVLLVLDNVNDITQIENLKAHSGLAQGVE